MTKVGYARVSTREQNLERQMDALEKAGCTRIFAEKRSGATMERPQLEQLLGYIHDDDEVVVVALDRLGRSAADLTRIIGDIEHAGATLNVLNLPSFGDVQNRAMRTMLTNLTMEIYKYIAEEERLAIRERQAEGIAVAKRRGVYTGRESVYAPDSADPHGRHVYKEAVTMLQAGHLSKAQIARSLGISRPTLYRIAADVQLD
jgi:DNA invertase Pin-like site-specific DNA recombinase